MKRIYRVLAVTLALFSAPAPARDVAGVQVPEAVTIEGETLALNGAGVRTRFFVKVYAGALYLPNRQATADGAIAAPGPKSVRLHIVHSEIGAEQMASALNDGFTGNSSTAELQALKDRIEQFRSTIPALRRGDLVRLDLLKDGGTEVWVNDAQRGVIPGADFQNALLKIWLGEKPADKSLKQAMLGR